MPSFTTEPSTEDLKRALLNIYVLAKRNRSVVYKYEKNEKGKTFAIPQRLKSKDEDWDNVIILCECVGIKLTPIRIPSTKGVEND